MMIKKALTFFLVLLTASAPALAQSASGSWDAVKGVYTDTKLEVRLTDGETLRGKMIDATDATLALLQDGKRVEVPRDRVQRVYAEGKRSVKRTTLIGAAVGGGGGLGIGLAIFSRGDMTRGAITVPAIAGAGIGAGVGALLGLRRGKPTLLYER
jgi:hypothetical protein